MDIKAIREKFPMYSDVGDAELVEAVRTKFYPDMDPKEFAARVTPPGALTTAAGGDAKNDPATLLKGSADQTTRDLATAGAAALRGAGSIGATLLTPYDYLAGNTKSIGNPERRKEMDDAINTIAQQTGLVDVDSLLYQGSKLGAEIAGTAGVGPALAGGARAVPLLAKLAPALSSSGMTSGIANPLLSGAARVAGGATTAGASGALIDPADALAAAGFGAVVPGVAKAAGVAGRGLGALGASVSEKGAQARAVQKIADAIGDGNVKQAIGDLQTYFPKLAEEIPVSSAAILRSPNVAALEQGARARNGASWVGFDERQATELWKNVERAVSGDAADLGARRVARNANWDANWGAAKQGFQPRNFASLMGGLKGNLDQAARSPAAVNDDVLSALKQIDSTVSRLGDDFSLDHLQALRAELRGKVNPNSKSALKQADRSDPAIISLKQELDDILRQSTSGRWDRVLKGYTDDSVKVGESRAAQGLLNRFVAEDSAGAARTRGVEAAKDVPRITEAGLGRAMDAALQPSGQSALSQGALDRLNATLDALRLQNQAVQRNTRAATAGGGSATASNLFAAGLESIPFSGQIMKTLQDLHRAGVLKTDRHLAGLLQNPDELARTLEKMSAQERNAIGLLGARALPALVADQ